MATDGEIEVAKKKEVAKARQHDSYPELNISKMFRSEDNTVSACVSIESVCELFCCRQE